MVSGLVTSPCDQDMIVSGEASDSRSASKFSSLSTNTPSQQLHRSPRSLQGRGVGVRVRRRQQGRTMPSFARVLTELLTLETDPQVQRNLRDVGAPRNLRFR